MFTGPVFTQIISLMFVRQAKKIKRIQRLVSECTSRAHMDCFPAVAHSVIFLMVGCRRTPTLTGLRFGRRQLPIRPWLPFIRFRTFLNRSSAPIRLRGAQT